MLPKFTKQNNNRQSERTFLHSSQCCSDVIIGKKKATLSGCWTGVSTPPTTETHCEGGPSSSRYCGLQIKEGGRRKPHLHKRKMGCLSSENNFSMKFPKKIPLAENKHWKSFQISVRSLSLSLSPCLPGPALSLFVVEVEESQPCGSQSSLH